MRPKLLALFLLLTALPATAEERRYFELTPEITLDTADVFRKMTIGSFEATYHLSDKFWFGAGFTGGRVSVDTPNGVGVDDGDPLYIADGLFYFNLPALLGATQKGDDGWRGDLYMTLGLGALWAGPMTEICGIFGGGLLIHTPIRWLGIRFDLKSILYMLENTAGSDFNNDTAINIGPSLMF